MPAFRDRLQVLSATIIVLAATSTGAIAQKKYDTVQQILKSKSATSCLTADQHPLTASSEDRGCVLRKINAEGGINGRKIKFISYDDAYSPPKTVEQARKLVESDEVLLIFGPLGTAPNSAIQKYEREEGASAIHSNRRGKVERPEAVSLDDGLGSQLSDRSSHLCQVYLKERPTGKIGILYQNDDYGKDYVKGIHDGLGAKAASMIVGEESYETSSPTIDSHVVALKSKGADVFISITTPKFAAQSIKKVAELGWKPLFILNSVGTSTGVVMRPAGFENGQNIISAIYQKDPTDPQWKDDTGIKNFDAFLAKYFPEGNREDGNLMAGYNAAQTIVQEKKKCGDDLTRANIMKQAASIQGLQLEGLLPGITLNTSATDFAPIKQFQLRKFKGERWELFGDVIGGELGG
jgi:branched-chain amino acid transport system substrate-binding protein